MRTIAIVTLCAFVATIPANAQQVQKIKARGANAAGACAGSLDMLGQFISRADNPDANKLRDIQTARDFFASLPRYPRTEITAAAEAFVTLMSNRLRSTQTVEDRQAIQREIVTVANGCYASVKAEAGALQKAAPTQAPAVQPAQPYETVPLQPYTTQPLILDPVPAQ